MSHAIRIAAVCAVLIGLSGPSLAGDDANDPNMKHYIPGAGFQHEDSYEMDRFWDRNEKQVGTAGASRADGQGPDKGQSRMDDGAATPATPREGR